ncbi:MAG: RNA polymerase sigma factor [Planctomycetota bacterium]|jgi:RNA polymerase sigma factor (sigma-70 family)
MGSEAVSEGELLQATLAGSRKAFGAIVEKYQGLVCGITYSATGNRARSEELAQETFVRAWTQLRQLRDLGSFRAWLCTIARNAAKKSIVKQGRDAADLAQPLEGSQEIQSIEPGPAEHAISKEQEAVVSASLREIPESYREPLVLFYRQQHSISQVAVELERGRKLLKAELASVVEDVIKKTRPGRVFTVAVIAALPAIVPQVASAAIAGTVAKGSAAAKSAWFLSSVGALLGPLLAFWGVIIGVRSSIADAKSAREGKFIKKAVLTVFFYYLAGVTIIFVVGWLLDQLHLSICGIIPPIMAVFALSFPVLGIWGRRRLRQIQKEEGTCVQDEHKILEMSKGTIYGVWAGSIMGAFCWLYLTAYSARDWIVLWTVVTAAVVIFSVATKLCLRARRQFYRVAMGVFVLAGLINLLVVNLRWESWKTVLKYHHTVTLRQVNLIVGATVVAFIVWALILDFKLQKIKRKEHRP